MWECHFQHTLQSQYSVLTKLQRQCVDITNREKRTEVKLNILLDTLRTAKSEEDLNETWTQVWKMLLEMRESNVESFNMEKAVLGDYKNLMQLQTLMLRQEIKKFQTRHRIVEPPCRKLMSEEFEALFLPRELMFCEVHVESLKNWRLGLWDGIVFADSMAETKLAEHSTSWVDNNITQLTTRYELKELLHDVRYVRVMNETYHVRRAELRMHKDRLFMHTAGVKKNLEDMRDYIEELATRKESENETTQAQLEQVEEFARKAQTYLVVHTLINQVESKLQRYTHNLKDDVERFEEQCKSKTAWMSQSSADFIKSIKTFSEGGNYDSGEALSISAEIVELNTMVEKSLADILMELSELKDFLMQREIEMFENTLKRLRTIATDLRFMEMLVGEIQKVQSDIKREVYTLKVNDKDFRKDVIKLSLNVSEWNEQTCPLQGLLNNWMELFNKIEVHTKYLLQPGMFDDDDMENEDPKKQKMKLKFKSVVNLQAVNFPSVVRDETSFADYRKDLFEEPPSDNSFMSNVCRHMWKRFSKMQDRAADFYSARGSNPVLREDVVQPTYNKLMEEVLVKFKYYHMQCEEMWSHMSQEFLETMNTLRGSASIYAEKNMNDFHTRKMKQLNEACKRARLKLKSKLEEDTRRRKILDEMLKPLHGYPGNRQLLEELTEEAMRIGADLQTNMDSSFNDSKEQVKAEFQSCLVQSRQFQDTMHDMVDKMFDLHISQKLADQIRIIKESSRKSSITFSATLLQQKIPSKSKTSKISSLSKVDDLALQKIKIDRSKVPKQHHLSFDNLKAQRRSRMDLRRLFFISTSRLIGRQQSTGTLTSKQFSTSTFTSRSQSLATLQISSQQEICYRQEGIILGTIQAMLKDYRTAFIGFMTDVDKKQALYNQSSKDWIRVWHINVEKVKQLYSVTYE